MAQTMRIKNEKELPYIPLGPFKLRFPFIHYKIESIEFIQGLIPVSYTHLDVYKRQT